MTSAQQVAWRAEPLIWGQGARVFEAFVEPTCPYSARAFPKLFDLVGAAGEDRLTLKVRLLSQPWHMFSGVICRAILAASTAEGGREAARRVMAAVYADREAFEFTRHAYRAQHGRDAQRHPRRYRGAERRAGRCGLREPRARPRGALAHPLRPPERRPRDADVHDRRDDLRGALSSGDPVEKWLETLALDDPASVPR